MSLPGGQVSLRFSLEGRLSESHLGRVFLRLKPFLISARRWSMMQPSFCGTKPFLTEKKTQRGFNYYVPCETNASQKFLAESENTGLLTTYLSFHSLLSVSWTLPPPAASFSSQPWLLALSSFCFPVIMKERVSLTAKYKMYMAIFSLYHLCRDVRASPTFSTVSALIRISQTKHHPHAQEEDLAVRQTHTHRCIPRRSMQT